VNKAKPFDIPKREVWEAFKRVKANQGAAGVDGQSIAEFEANLKGNLYKLWNRMSSGSYFPAPVRWVDIPKADGDLCRGAPRGRLHFAQFTSFGEPAPLWMLAF
jgi:RNA-directed DNA polymerase